MNQGSERMQPVCIRMEQVRARLILVPLGMELR